MLEAIIVLVHAHHHTVAHVPLHTLLSNLIIHKVVCKNY